MSSSLRVLMHCGGSHVGGAEIVALNLMRGLKQRGHELHCTMSGWNDGEFPQRLEEIGVSYTPIKLGMFTKRLTPKYLKWTLDALVHLPGALLAFRRVQNTFSPDVVVVHSVRAAAKLRPLLEADKTVHYVHSKPNSALHTRLAMGPNGEHGAAHVAVSDYIAEQLRDLGISSRKVVVNHNGVRGTSVSHDAPPSTSTDNEPLKIGIVGQVGKWKGHEDFIEALHLLRKERETEAHGVIVGEGSKSFKERLLDQIQEYGIGGSIDWRGFVRDTDEIYAGLDVCVVPSRVEESFGLVAAEAGIRGIPVVATRRGGLPEIIVDGETGFLVGAKQPEQLASRLRDLGRNPELRTEMGQAARRRIRERFTVDRMVERAERVFKKVAAE